MQCTEKQAKVLEKYGYDSNVSMDRASQIITAIKDAGWKRPASLPREEDAPQRGAAGTATRRPPGRKGTKSYDGPATAKQCALLEKYDYDPTGMSFADASKLIDRIAANNWRRPDFDEDYDDDDSFEDDDDTAGF